MLEWGDKAEDIPDEFLLASPAFPSALQVFASVGGLALLAEHLPLLYPHIARQGMAADVGGTARRLFWRCLRRLQSCHSKFFFADAVMAEILLNLHFCQMLGF